MVGQFGPTFACNTGRFRFRDSGPYIAGVLIGSVLSIGALHLALGSRLQHLPVHSQVFLAVAVISAWLVADLVRMWAGQRSSLGINRQTPYDWRLRGSMGVFAWGVDTGTPVTTIRVTPFPFLGVVLVGVGLGSPFHGLAYGSGVIAGVMSAVAHSGRQERHLPKFNALMRRRDESRVSNLVLAPYLGVALTVAVSWILSSP